MIWAGWLIALLAWLAIGLGVAYLFGRFVEGAEALGKVAREPSAAMLRLHHARRTKTSLRKRATAHPPLWRETAGRRVG